jgi:hypothetical protein
MLALRMFLWPLLGALILGIVLFGHSRASYASITFSGNVQFTQNLAISGTLSKGSGTFAIDDPLNPAHYILFHSFVESPDAKNLYDGIATLDKNGEATITLPDYFMALNKDFRYQFFPIGTAMPNLYVKEEVVDNHFTIAGGVPNGRISWQVTGTRHDAYILANPIIPEVEKSDTTIVKKGDCLFEPLCQ